MENQRRLGLVLLLLGLFLLANYFNLFPGEIVLLVLSIGFAVAYVYMGAENYYSLGMIIPSLMLMAIYLYTVTESLLPLGIFESSLFFGLVSLGFFLVWLIHTRRFKKGGGNYWPLIVAGSTGGFAVFVLTIEMVSSPLAREQAGIYVPAFLIAVGIIIVIAGMIKPKK